jgi:hypothetical protein
VLISADTDFGMLLPQVTDDLHTGAIVVFGEDFVRVRPLPI